MRTMAASAGKTWTKLFDVRRSGVQVQFSDNSIVDYCMCPGFRENAACAASFLLREDVGAFCPNLVGAIVGLTHVVPHVNPEVVAAFKPELSPCRAGLEALCNLGEVTRAVHALTTSKDSGLGDAKLPRYVVYAMQRIDVYTEEVVTAGLRALTQANNIRFLHGDFTIDCIVSTSFPGEEPRFGITNFECSVWEPSISVVRGMHDWVDEHAFVYRQGGDSTAAKQAYFSFPRRFVAKYDLLTFVYSCIINAFPWIYKLLPCVLVPEIDPTVVQTMVPSWLEKLAKDEDIAEIVTPAEALAKWESIPDVYSL